MLELYKTLRKIHCQHLTVAYHVMVEIEREKAYMSVSISIYVKHHLLLYLISPRNPRERKAEREKKNRERVRKMLHCIKA
jgi:hypothetical protein